MNKNFTLLLTGQSLSNIGDVLYMVGIISTIFGLTGSATAAAFVPFTITTSMFISQLFMPLFIGKVSLKWLLTGSQQGKTVLIAILGVLFAGFSKDNYYWVFLIISGIAFLDGCANPIMHAMIPHYVKPDQLVRANGISASVIQLIQTVMWFVGSLLLVIMEPLQLIWVVGGLFILASGLFFCLENIHAKTTEQESKGLQMKKGWLDLLATPVLRKITQMEILETIASTVWIAAIIYVFVSEALQVGEEWWGLINGFFFVGLIIGSIFCIRYSLWVESKLSELILVSTFCSFIITIFFGMTSLPFAALGLSLGIGLFEQLRSIPLQTIIQSSLPKERIATVYTSLGAVSTGVFGVSSLGMGIIADMFGIRSVFLVSGILLAIVTIIIYKNKHLFIRNILA